MAPLVRSTSSMSLVPMQYRSWWDDWDLPLYGRMLEKSVTQEVLEDHPYFWRNAPLPPLRWSSLWRPWRYFSLRDVGSRVDSDREKFLIEVDVHQFAPHEVTVRKTDKYVTIEGKHEEKRDELGYVARQFSRRYMIPSEYFLGMVENRGLSNLIFRDSIPLFGMGLYYITICYKFII